MSERIIPDERIDTSIVTLEGGRVWVGPEHDPRFLGLDADTAERLGQTLLEKAAVLREARDAPPQVAE